MLNDNFDHASSISRHQTPTVDTTGATLEPGESQPCGNIGATVWYVYQAPADFTITLDTSGSDFDTVLAAYWYGATSPPGALHNLGCNDDVSASDTTSSLTLDVTAGSQYFFQLGGKDGATGNAVLHVVEPPGGSISGTVRDGEGNPIAGAQVTVSRQPCCLGDGATTAADGTYTVSDLPPGSYSVFADAVGYVGAYWNDGGSPGSATYVDVAGGADVAGIDFALGPTGSISGTVTDSHGAPIAGATVSAWAIECCGGGGSATTAADGTYTIDDLDPASYEVFASANGYAAEYYDNTYDYSSGTPVGVSEGTTHEGIDFSLVDGASISGTVLAQDGTPLANAYVDASSMPCCVGGGAAPTDAGGHYTVGNLPAGSYSLQVYANGYPTQYYDGVYDTSTATAVTVSVGEARTGIDFQLQPGGQITGTVTADGSPVAGAYVSAYPAGGCCGYGGGTTTASDGTYTIDTLAPGSYVVSVSAQSFVPQYYDGATDYASATAVAVTSGGTTSGIDFALSAGGAIEGTVRDTGGGPLAGAYVSAYNTSSGGGGSATTDSDGHYHIQGLVDANYDVYASAVGYAGQYYNGVYSSAAATVVPAAAGATTTGIDFALPAAGTISGHVTLSGTQPPYVYVYAVGNFGACCPFGSSSINLDGSYSIPNLPPGDYTVYAIADGYDTQYYDHVQDPGAATPVTVASSTDTSGIDFALDAVTPPATNTPTATATTAVATPTPVGTATNTPVPAPPGDAIERIMPDLLHVDTSIPTVTTDVTVSDVTNLGAYEVDIVYDSSVVEFDGWVDGGFLGSTGKTLQCPPAAVSTISGTMKRLQAGCGLDRVCRGAGWRRHARDAHLVDRRAGIDGPPARAEARGPPGRLDRYLRVQRQRHRRFGGNADGERHAGERGHRRDRDIDADRNSDRRLRDRHAGANGNGHIGTHGRQYRRAGRDGYRGANGNGYRASPPRRIQRCPPQPIPSSPAETDTPVPTATDTALPAETDTAVPTATRTSVVSDGIAGREWDRRRRCDGVPASEPDGGNADGGGDAKRYGHGVSRRDEHQHADRHGDRGRNEHRDGDADAEHAIDQHADTNVDRGRDEHVDEHGERDQHLGHRRFDGDAAEHTDSGRNGHPHHDGGRARCSAQPAPQRRPPRG